MTGAAWLYAVATVGFLKMDGEAAIDRFLDSEFNAMYKRERFVPSLERSNGCQALTKSDVNQDFALMATGIQALEKQDFPKQKKKKSNAPSPPPSRSPNERRSRLRTKLEKSRKSRTHVKSSGQQLMVEFERGKKSALNRLEQFLMRKNEYQSIVQDATTLQEQEFNFSEENERTIEATRLLRRACAFSVTETVQMLTNEMVSKEIADKDGNIDKALLQQEVKRREEDLYGLQREVRGLQGRLRFIEDVFVQNEKKEDASAPSGSDLQQRVPPPPPSLEPTPDTATESSATTAAPAPTLPTKGARPQIPGEHRPAVVGGLGVNPLYPISNKDKDGTAPTSTTTNAADSSSSPSADTDPAARTGTASAPVATSSAVPEANAFSSTPASAPSATTTAVHGKSELKGASAAVALIAEIERKQTEIEEKLKKELTEKTNNRNAKAAVIGERDTEIEKEMELFDKMTAEKNRLKRLLRAYDYQVKAHLKSITKKKIKLDHILLDAAAAKSNNSMECDEEVADATEDLLSEEKLEETASNVKADKDTNKNQSATSLTVKTEETDGDESNAMETEAQTSDNAGGDNGSGAPSGASSPTGAADELEQSGGASGDGSSMDIEPTANNDCANTTGTATTTNGNVKGEESKSGSSSANGTANSNELSVKDEIYLRLDKKLNAVEMAKLQLHPDPHMGEALELLRSRTALLVHYKAQRDSLQQLNNILGSEASELRVDIQRKRKQMEVARDECGDLFNELMNLTEELSALDGEHDELLFEVSDLNERVDAAEAEEQENRVSFLKSHFRARELGYSSNALITRILEEDAAEEE